MSGMIMNGVMFVVWLILFKWLFRVFKGLEI